MAWLEFFIIFIGIMLVSSIGFKSYVWFISLGYGLGISVTGILLLLMYHSMMDIYQIIACVIFILYGFRLSGFWLSCLLWYWFVL